MRTPRRVEDRYVAYLRCSTDDQKEGDYSTIDTQRELCTAYVSGKGAVLGEVYADEGRTGTNLKRPEWERLLADAKSRRFTVVVVTYMSRLGRGDAGTVAEYLLREAGVRVEYVKESFTADTAGFVNKTMTRFVDAMYVENVRQWTRTKMEQMVKRGYFCGGTVPFGYRAVPIPEAGVANRDKEPPKRLVPDPDEAPIVRQAFALFAESHSFAVVRDYLKSVTDRKWHIGTVRYMLTNRVYIGALDFGSWHNERAYEPIMAREEWQAVQEFARRPLPRAARGNGDFTYYLRGKVRCPYCGCSYTHYEVPRPGYRVRYYACLSNMKRITRCPVGRVNADKLHAAVLREVTEAATHATRMHRVIAESGGWERPDEALLATRAQLAKRAQFLGMQIGNITRAIGAGRAVGPLLSALEKLEAEQAEVQMQRDKLEARIAAATVKRPRAADVMNAWRGIPELWPSLTEEERTQVLSAVVERVEPVEKLHVDLFLSTGSGSHEGMLATDEKMGAGAGLEPATFGL